MPTKVLLTTTSYQDTPGEHHQMLESQGYEISRARGPLPESEMLKLVGEFDGIICGDDAFTRAVLGKCLPRLKVLSKYGIGIDKIDLKAATDLGIPVCFTPGVNHTAVAEHVFALLLALTRNVIAQHAVVAAGNWKRATGHEIWGKTMWHDTENLRIYVRRLRKKLNDVPPHMILNQRGSGYVFKS